MSSFLNLNWVDLGKAALVAAIGAIGMTLLPILESGGLPTLENLKVAGITALAAGLSYLVKNLLTNSTGQVLKVEPKQ
jgi:hypothetical protein